MYVGGSGEDVTDKALEDNSIVVPKHLNGKCLFCPRGFDQGERMVFFTKKKHQSRVMNNEEGISEVVTHATVQICNGHLECCLKHKQDIRGVCSKQTITKGKF